MPRETREQLLAQTAPVSQQPWPLLTATAYGRFKADGDRQEYERPYFARRDKLMAAVITAILTGDTSTADITDGVWLLCEETSWCLPAHQPGGLPDPDHPHVDLFAAETAALLAWTAAADRRARGPRPPRGKDPRPRSVPGPRRLVGGSALTAART